METSDSEYFESADEEFLSDNEEEGKKTQTVNINSTNQGDVIKNPIQEISTLKLTSNVDESNLINIDDNKNTSKPLPLKTECTTETIVQKDDENNLHMETQLENQEKQECKRKLNSENVLKIEKKTEILNVEKASEVQQTILQKTENKFEHSTIIENKKPDNHSQVKGTETEIIEKSDDNSSNKFPDANDSEESLWDHDELDWDQPHKDEEPNMWENDAWETIEETSQSDTKVEETMKHEDSKLDSWGTSWGNWGVSSLLSTATQGVSTLTQGISTVLESGIGVPNPEELAKMNKAEKETLKNLHETETDKNTMDNHQTGFGLGNLVMGVSHLTKFVETTGSKVITGGLDTLETIGKKTMEVLQEGDPGLKKKRAFLRMDHDKPVLSQLLREAKEKAEKENKELEQKHYAKKAKNYETLFDDHQGLVHLEALEMLSKQCDIKLQTLLETYSGDALIELQETMDQVKELCELPGEEEDEQFSFIEIQENLKNAITEINIPITYKKLIETWEETELWLKHLKLEVCDERELHQQAIETLAQLTAIAVEQFHKSGELLLVKEHRSTADEADSLVQLTTNLVTLIGIVANSFSDKLNAKTVNSKHKDDINGLITNVFLEAANSSSYIQDAFQLLVPVLQAGAV